MNAIWAKSPSRVEATVPEDTESLAKADVEVDAVAYCGDRYPTEFDTRVQESVNSIPKGELNENAKIRILSIFMLQYCGRSTGSWCAKTSRIRPSRLGDSVFIRSCQVARDGRWAAEDGRRRRTAIYQTFPAVRLRQIAIAPAYKLWQIVVLQDSSSLKRANDGSGQVPISIIH